jgi:hypothetical protein
MIGRAASGAGVARGRGVSKITGRTSYREDREDREEETVLLENKYEHVFVIAYEGETEVIYRFAPSAELLSSLDEAERRNKVDAVVLESSPECVTVPLILGDGIELFFAKVGKVTGEKISRDELLRLTKTDGVDMFY